MGGRGATSSIGGKSKSLETHFQNENKRIEEFMKKSSGQIEMKNGQILEHYTMKEMLDNVVKEAKAGGLGQDDTVSILYNNGDFIYYNGGNINAQYSSKGNKETPIDSNKIKLTGIKGVIYDNAGTTAYAGKGIKIENYNETLAGQKGTDYGKGKYADDWRMDFEYN